MFEQLDAWVTAQLAAGTGASAWLVLFVGGVLASLLPCVYPIYPITAAILRGRASRLGFAAHPLAYYGGLVGVYVGFGVIAALSGGAFNEVIRTPAFNVGVGAVLAVLAGAVVGLLEFPVLAQPGPARADDHRLVGTAAMGAGAGLLSSACVGPVVVSVLVGLVAASGRGAVELSTIANAATKMGLFGAGVGAPIVAIGVFGLSLPRSGPWMVWVQRAFGVLIGYFAIGYVTKGLLGLGLGEGEAWAVQVGALLVGGAVYGIQSSELPAYERGRTAYLALGGLCGALIMARVLLPGAGVGPGSVGAAQAETTHEVEHGLTWHLDREQAYAEAARTGKPVFIDFYATWCSNCKAFSARLAADEAFKAALAGAVLLKIYDTSPLFAEYRDDPRFPELTVGLPFFLITDAQGNVLYKTADFTKTREMSLFLES